MRPVRVRQLLALASVADAEGRVEKAYDWYFETQKLVVQAVLVFSTAYSVALVVAAIREDLSLGAAALDALVGVGGPGLLGVLAYRELRLLPDDYLEALAALDELKVATAGQG